MKFRFPIVIIDEDFRSENTSGLGIRALAQAIEKEGMEVLGVTSYGDLSQFAQQQIARLGLHPVDRRRGIHARARDRSGDRQPAHLHQGDPLQERRDPDLPVRRDAHVAAHPQRHPARAARLHPHVRGHAGIRRAPHHPRGQVLPRLAGAAVLPRAGALRAGRLLLLALPGALGRRGVPEEPGRADVPPVLRREHAARRRLQRGRRTGPAARPHRPGGRGSERNAARIFNADHCFFVTNGTSTSNKMVWHANVAPGDIVVVDRNCHKSILHAITMTGAIPVFLHADAQPPGHHRPDPAGGIQAGEHREEDRGESVRARGEEQEAAHPDASPRAPTTASSTTSRCSRRRSTTAIDTLHFDEAWLPHATFHEFYRDMHAIGRDRPRSKDAMIFATHSTHKLLAGISQASQILVQDSRDPEARPADLQRGLPDAHVDLAAVRDHRVLRRGGGDDGAAGRHRAGRGVDHRGARFPPRDAQGRRRVGQGLVVQGLGSGASRRRGHQAREDWMLRANEKWHGFGNLAPGFNMLDPIKATVITPGLDVSGKFAKTGIPASIVTTLPGRARRHRREDRACTRSSSCSPSASPRDAGTRC